MKKLIGMCLLYEHGAVYGKIIDAVATWVLIVTERDGQWVLTQLGDICDMKLKTEDEVEDEKSDAAQM